jgi:phenylacetate-CoA ligase
MSRRPQFGSGRTDRLVFRKWGFPWLPESELGDRIYIPTDTPVAEQLDRLASRAPAYVNTLPSNILRLGRAARDSGKIPSIPILISISEYLGSEVRSLAEEVFGSRVIGIFSSAEGGTMGIECAETQNLHVQGETVLVEILDADGQPCEPGEIGEVVITPLYNYATPLIRYRTGDFAVKGGPCPCGRSCFTIERIVGRREHMFALPDGSRIIPDVDRIRITDLIGHEAWQFVQTGPDTAEFRFESPSQIAVAADAIRGHLLSSLNGELAVTLKEVKSITMTSGGTRHFCINEWRAG